jgi:hypothetical protein
VPVEFAQLHEKTWPVVKGSVNIKGRMGLEIELIPNITFKFVGQIDDSTIVWDPSNTRFRSTQQFHCRQAM